MMTEMGKQKTGEMPNIIILEPITVGDKYIGQNKREGLTKKTRYMVLFKLFNILCLSFLIYYNEKILWSSFQR